jgi:uncharacterized protein
MRVVRYGLCAWIAIVGALCAAIPTLRDYVNDEANLLRPDERAALTAKLRDFENATSNQIFILTTPSLDGMDIETYSIEVAEAWKAGQKGTDNGIIIVVAPTERKMRIEVGYGLEGAVPDGLAGEIIRDHLVPAFRENAYARGFNDAVDALIAATKGEYTAPMPRNRLVQQVPRRVAPFIVLMVLIALVAASSQKSRRTTFGGRGRNLWGGPPFFGGGGGFGGFGGGSGGGGFSGGGGGGFGGGGASGSW